MLEVSAGCFEDEGGQKNVINVAVCVCDPLGFGCEALFQTYMSRNEVAEKLVFLVGYSPGSILWKECGIHVTQQNGETVAGIEKAFQCFLLSFSCFKGCMLIT
eukprot:256718-Pelagomonas_calceolata.AAC.1